MTTLPNDLPTLQDLLDRKELVQRVGRELTRCATPQVFGVHGAWGSGKTSFLHQLHLFLTGGCPESLDEGGGAKAKAQWQAELATDQWGADWKAAPQVAVVWFEAWRYQHESNPVVPLLHEIRSQLGWRARSTNEVRKLGEAGLYGALLSLEGLTKSLGLQPSKMQQAGESWEKEHHATPLPTHVLRQLLDQAIRQLLGKSKRGQSPPRLVVMVDDLDRCQPKAAYRLLEGIKVYLNIPSCVFVLGMDRGAVELAVAQRLGRHGREGLAREYVEKICQTIWALPLVEDPAVLLGACLPGVQGALRCCAVVRHYRCLPANPRKIKAFANVLRRFLEQVGLQDEEGWEPRDDEPAGLVVVMAYLYQFHPEIYRRIERDSRFFEVLRIWAAHEAPVRHEILDDLVLPFAAGEVDPHQVVGRPDIEYTHPDPMRGDVFWIQMLLADLQDVPADEIRAAVLR